MLLSAFGERSTFLIGLPVMLLLGSTPPEKAGAASTLRSTSGELRVASGIAALGSIGTAVYQGNVVLPAGVPQTAGESIAAAVTVAPLLPPQAGAGLLDSVRAAFTDGLHAVTAVTVMLYFLLAVISAALLRHPAASGAAHEAVLPCESHTCMLTLHSPPGPLRAERDGDRHSLPHGPEQFAGVSAGSPADMLAWPHDGLRGH
ncbi:hypothetical protein [Nonomuraea rhizosphaerae]|uniref:hypothetical protein n=1 Tax=Nonomuraea rhizosphaerae TaxID=2665663 RepID=UPI001C5D596E|nr:hypothetical protein [Nonomuraea rhizosphaerae]